MVAADYYLLIGEQEQGPWTLPQVQAFWLAGAVTLETLFAQPGMGEWKPLSSIPDFASAATATPQAENPYTDEQRNTIEAVVNVLLPSETIPEANDAPDEPEEVDTAKLRRWLQEKLAALEFEPETKMAVTNREKFGDWVSQFSGEDQQTLFGAGNIHRYRNESLAWQSLIRVLQRLAASNPEKTSGNGEPLTPENIRWMMDIVSRALKGTDFISRNAELYVAAPKSPEKVVQPTAKQVCQVPTRPTDGTKKSAVVVIDASSVIQQAAAEIESGIFEDDQKLDAYYRKQSPLGLAASFGKAAAAAFFRGAISAKDLMRQDTFKLSPETFARLNKAFTEIDANWGIKSEPKETPEPVKKPPQEIHLTKLWLWLLKNLATLGLTPMAAKPAGDAATFATWLDELSDLEQDEIFGVEKMELYRSGEMTSRALRDELKRVATCIAIGSSDDLLSLVYGLFDDEERMTLGNAPRAVALVEQALRKEVANPRVRANANKILARIYTDTGQTDKAAALSAVHPKLPFRPAA